MVPSMRFIFSLLLTAVQVCCGYQFYENFDQSWQNRWKHSSDDKYNGEAEIGQPPVWNDTGLRLPINARHYGLSALTEQQVDPSKGVVLQYEVKPSPDGWSCGGAYLKFLTHNPGFAPQDLVDSTPYTIMFGPDKCGGTNKVHFIMRHTSPKTGEIEEKHLSSPPTVDGSKFTAIYTLILKSDNSYQVLVNDEVQSEGQLHGSFTPDINPPEEISDVQDLKPEDWVDASMIPDPHAKKPEDWDEDAPEYIDDPEAAKPADWDDEEDGEWRPPQVLNPEYKGQWSPPMIDNPEYKGIWKPRNIPNPDYYDDETPLEHIGKIGGVALEVWTMDRDFYFDNILITDNELEASEFRKVWKEKRDAEEKAKLEEDKEVLRDASSGAAKKIRELVDAATFLDPYRAHIDPYLTMLDVEPNAVYIVFGAPVGLLIVILLYCLLGRRKSDDTGRAKKDDEPTPDDATPEKDEGEEEKQQQEEEEDDEEDEGGVRQRRTQRVD